MLKKGVVIMQMKNYLTKFLNHFSFGTITTQKVIIGGGTKSPIHGRWVRS